MSALSPEAIEQQLDAASRVCSRQSAQLTQLRRSVLGLVLQAERPITAYQLLDQLKATREGAMPPTVYRTLDFLMGKQLIHRIERLNAFVACTDPGQHTHSVQFLICSDCGKVTELEDRAVSHALDKAAMEGGFRLSNVIVELEGLCAACAA
jgi:Fur family zinc uptake transcriptional regulator